MGLIMLDIDNFKRVNDTYGHMQGDLVLREVARVLQESSREIDEPARYGGEEMAVALPGTDLDGAYLFAERVRRSIESLDLPLIDGEGSLRVTASFGAAALPSDQEKADKDSLVAAADAALYRAKRSGKNRTVRAE
jgi:diguanylate cyclase (GGDEF)-like protein